MGKFDHIVAAMEASPLVAALREMGRSGDFSSLERNAAKRQHFLPQLLLRNFAHSHRGRDYLFQVETGRSRAPRRMDIRDAASRHRLYTAVDEEGRISNRNEGYLALVETHAGPALQHLIDDPLSLSPGERATVAMFVALQAMRTPASLEQVTTVANAALKMAVGEVCSDRQAFAARYREEHGDGKTAEEIEAFRQEMLERVRSGDVRLNGDRGAAVAAALQHAIENVPKLFQFDWKLLQAPSGGIITSDRGYAIYDPTPPFPWVAQGILSSASSETTMPLSDTACLLMRPIPMSGRTTVEELSTRELERINLRTYGWADRHAFARSQASLDAVRAASRRRPEDVIRPKPFCEVILLEPDPDDTSLVEDNRRRGWPPRLPNEHGEPLDYLVIPLDEPHPELWKLADDLAERRAHKRAGIGEDEPLVGRITNTSLHPFDLA